MKAEERPELPAELTGQGHDMGVALQMVDPRLPPLNTPVFPSAGTFEYMVDCATGC
jgi:hypothetical protein